MKRIVGWIAGALIAWGGTGFAEEHPVVVELFTSQGCSSCPPADKLLAEMAGRDDIIPLALHIDYWDYIGWKDDFAKPAFTRRQKGYARAAERRSVYTPQMIINGVDDVIGNRPMQVTDLIRAHAEKPMPVDLALSRDGDVVTIRAEAALPMGSLDVHVLRYLPLQEVVIRHGENAGRTLTYSHIVTQWDVHAQWGGAGRYHTSLEVTGSEPVVVLLQKSGYGPIVAAARLR